MAIGTPTLKLTNGTTTDATSFTTASSTFVSGRVYLLGLEYSRGSSTDAAAPTSVVTNAGATVAWTKIADLIYKTTGTNRTSCAIYVGVCSGVGGAATTTITFGYTALGAEWALVEYTGVDTTTPYKVANVKTTIAAPANGATATVTLDALTNTSSRSFVVTGGNSNTLLYTADADWTQIAESQHNTPDEFIQVCYATNETAFTILNGFTNPNAIGMIAVELLPAPVSSTLGRGQETDLGRTPVLSKAVTLGRGQETDSGRALTVSKGALTLARAVESDAGRALAITKTLTLGRAQEVDSGRALTITTDVVVTLGRAQEADSVRALTTTKTLTLGRAVETDAARAIVASEAATLARAVETDAGRALTVGKAVTLGRANETDAVRAILASEAATLARAVETDAARAVTLAKVITLGRAEEVDAGRALSISGSTGITLGRAQEIDAARSLVLAKVYTLGRASEADNARAITAAKAGTFGRANEVDNARPLIVIAGVGVSLGRAQEIDTARVLSLVKSVILGRASETDGARALSHARSITLGRAGEVDGVRALTVEVVHTYVPPEHVYYVPAESRLLVVLADPRTLYVPPDDRLDEAPIRVDYLVPEDTRLVSA
jgi:hypothetical protein